MFRHTTNHVLFFYSLVTDWFIFDGDLYIFRLNKFEYISIFLYFEWFHRQKSTCLYAGHDTYQIDDKLDCWQKSSISNMLDKSMEKRTNFHAYCPLSSRYTNSLALFYQDKYTWPSDPSLFFFFFSYVFRYKTNHIIIQYSFNIQWFIVIWILWVNV